MTPRVLELACGRNPTPGCDVYHDMSLHAPYVNVAHNLNDLPWPWADGEFTAIVAYDIVEHLKLDVHQWLGECWRILSVGGLLDIRAPHWTSRNAYINPTHYRAFDELSFVFWDPDHPWHAQYGEYDPTLAGDGRLWKIERSGVDKAQNCHFWLRKRAPSGLTLVRGAV